MEHEHPFYIFHQKYKIKKDLNMIGVVLPPSKWLIHNVTVDLW